MMRRDGAEGIMMMGMLLSSMGQKKGRSRPRRPAPGEDHYERSADGRAWYVVQKKTRRRVRDEAEIAELEARLKRQQTEDAEQEATEARKQAEARQALSDAGIDPRKVVVVIGEGSKFQ